MTLARWDLAMQRPPAISEAGYSGYGTYSVMSALPSSRGRSRRIGIIDESLKP
jgi:hypothetical protein